MSIGIGEQFGARTGGLGGGSGGGGFPITVNDGPQHTTGLLPLTITRQPMVPPTGIVQPLPPLFGFRFDGSVNNNYPLSTTAEPTTSCVGSDLNLWITDHSGAAPGVWQINLSTPGVAPTFFPASFSGTQPNFSGICQGPDGNNWITDIGRISVWRVTTAGVFTEFPATLGAGNNLGYSIVTGPDGNLWANVVSTGSLAGGLLRITTAGAQTFFPQGVAGTSSFNSCCAGPDGNVWACDPGSALIWRVTPTGVGASFSFPSDAPVWIVAGPDGTLWFDDDDSTSVYEMDVNGNVLQTILMPSSGTSSPQGIVIGGGGDLWVTDPPNGTLVKITPHGTATAFTVGLGSLSPNQVTVGPDGSFFIICSQKIDGTNFGLVAMPFVLEIQASVQTQGAWSYRRTQIVNAPGATPSVNTSQVDFIHFTGIATNITSLSASSAFLTANQDGQLLQIAFTDNGSTKTIGWSVSFESSAHYTLPANTGAGGVRLDVFFTFNLATTKWRCVNVA